MYNKNPEQYLAGVNLKPTQEQLIGKLASKIYRYKPEDTAIGMIAENYQLGESTDPEAIRKFLKRLKKVEIWATLPTAQPLIFQTGETIIYATLSSPWHQDETTILYKRNLLVDPYQDEVHPTNKSTKPSNSNPFSKN